MYDADYSEYLNKLKEEAANIELKTPAMDAGHPSDFVVRDSGKKAQYDDGMQRDDPTGKPKFRLLWPEGVPYEEQLMYRVAMHYMLGGMKYGDRNWEKSCTGESLAAHADAVERHFQKFLSGVEDGEDHAAAVVWGINAVLLTRRNIAQKALKEEIAAAWGDEVTTDAAPPEWARHSAQCCHAPAYSSLPFTYNDSCGKGQIASTPLVEEADPGELALKDYHSKPYVFPFIGPDTASTGKYHQTAIYANSYAEAKFIFDNWLSKQPHYNAFPDIPATSPVPVADLEWSEGDVLEENAPPTDGPYCWGYQACTDTWLYKGIMEDPSPQSARSLKKLAADFGPLTCTKGSHTGRVVGGS